MSKCANCRYQKIDSYFMDYICKNVNVLGTIEEPEAERECAHFNAITRDEMIDNYEDLYRQVCRELGQLKSEVTTYARQQDLIDLTAEFVGNLKIKVDELKRVEND